MIAICTPSLQTLALESSGFWDQEVGGKERAEKEATPPHPPTACLQLRDSRAQRWDGGSFRRSTQRLKKECSSEQRAQIQMLWGHPAGYLQRGVGQVLETRGGRGG